MTIESSLLKPVEIQCRCGSRFIFEVGEQLFLQQLERDGNIAKAMIPTRCRPCRILKKQRRMPETVPAPAPDNTIGDLDW